MSSFCINCNCKDNIQLLATAAALLLRQNHAIPPLVYMYKEEDCIVPGELPGISFSPLLSTFISDIMPTNTIIQCTLFTLRCGNSCAGATKELDRVQKIHRHELPLSNKLHRSAKYRQ